MYLRLQDRRLGIIWRIFLLIIMIYVLVFNVIINQGYLSYEAPTAGSVRYTIHPGSSYANPIMLPYCSQYNNYLNKENLFKNQECVFATQYETNLNPGS